MHVYGHVKPGSHDNRDILKRFDISKVNNAARNTTLSLTNV